MLIFGGMIFTISIHKLLLVLIAPCHAIRSTIFNVITFMEWLRNFLVVVWFHHIVVTILEVLIVIGHWVLGVMDTPIAE